MFCETNPLQEVTATNKVKQAEQQNAFNRLGARSSLLKEAVVLINNVELHAAVLSCQGAVTK